VRSERRRRDTVGSVSELASRWEQMIVEKDVVFEGKGEMEVLRVRGKRRAE
jgi:hypothetical protein